MIDELLIWDLSLFELINGAHNTAVDTFMYYVSEKWPWIPLYLLCIGFVYKKEGWKGMGIFLVSIVVLIFLSDRITSGFMKPYFQRLRPCRLEADLEFVVHIVREHCGGKYGFASSHAANFFALAGFLSRYFSQNVGNRKISFLIFGLASLVAYSRIYLGVHYPGDVIVGALIGLLAAWVSWQVFTLLKKLLLI